VLVVAVVGPEFAAAAVVVVVAVAVPEVELVAVFPKAHNLKNIKLELIGQLFLRTN
jgi:hypothetical protein